MTNFENLFNSYKPLDQPKLKELLRLSGGYPKEVNYPLPHNYSDFLSLLKSLSSPPSKDDLLSLLRTFNSNFITKKTLEKYFLMGDKFTEDEMRQLMRMIPFDKTDSISLGEFVDIAYN